VTVAHLDHGIRPASPDDARFVATLADKYKMPFITERVELGPSASEATARQARYDFLDRAQKITSADGLITAHHFDDVIETAIINLIRGSGRKGLTSLDSRPGLFRPLLQVTKQEILDYAKLKGLKWREDETNRDTKYLRNYVRHNVLPVFSHEQKEQLKAIIKHQQNVNKSLDALLVKYFSNREENCLDRRAFVLLPHTLAKEIMAAWLRQAGVRDFDRKAIDRLVVGAKTALPGKHLNVLKRNEILVEKERLSLL
jgi:tRNA(Ile)-lysidine synthase